MHRCGFVAVLGLPNVGKSTLINAFLDKQLCITSYRPQTTRFHIRCVSSSESRQIVFVDTPGWVPRGRDRLGKFMRREIHQSADGVDVGLYVVDATRDDTPRNQSCYKSLTRDVAGARILALNKTDRLKRPQLLPILDHFNKVYQPDAIVPVSAQTGDNLPELDRVLSQHLPEGPPFYPEEILIDRPDPFVFSEFIREQVYRVTRQELPFSCSVRIEEVHDGEPGPLRILAHLVVERDTQKAILIGKRGGMIHRLKGLSTARIRRYAGRKVELDLLVKVRKDWKERIGDV